MVSLQKVPDEITNFVSRHNLVRADILATEQPAPLQQAITQVAALAMRGFAELAGQPSSREQLWNATREAAAAGPGATTTATVGGDLLRKVLDDRYHGTVSTTAAAAGVSAATISHLLELVPATALAVIGDAVAEQHWTAKQLADWLRPRQHVPVVPTPVPAPTPRPVSGVVPSPSSWFAKPANALLVVVSIVAVAEFGYILNTRSGDVVATAPVTTTSTPAATPVDGPAAPEGQYLAIPAVSRSAARPKAAVPVVLKLKNGVRQVIGANSTESKLYQFLIDPSKEVDPNDPTKDWIGFDRIYFDTNKATLTNESLWQLSNVASILKRFPDAKIKIGGYTDNSGKPLVNLLLSKHRAEAAKEALVSLGVAADRLTAAGYGTIDNIAPNDTEEGRALNRRVSLQVTQK
ncbi:OmpA family protein [Hymenobacter setariae]|uniref:OmpA family protein n=1 Tax=Hymenobacter setariae TaxID=2594794 RepID=A0A558BMV3_9BACT|nr:OmpA family protein [Hymenobacter setariae]TVT37837.1 OmpA family protein [Hymenobacter setariae]